MSGKRDNEELGMVKIYKDGAEVAHYSSGCIIVQAQGFTRNRVVKPILVVQMELSSHAWKFALAITSIECRICPTTRI